MSARTNRAVPIHSVRTRSKTLVEREIRATMTPSCFKLWKRISTRCSELSSATFACRDVLEGKLKRNNASQMKNVDIDLKAEGKDRRQGCQASSP